MVGKYARKFEIEMFDSKCVSAIIDDCIVYLEGDGGNQLKVEILISTHKIEDRHLLGGVFCDFVTVLKQLTKFF